MGVAQLDKVPEYNRLKDLGLHIRPAGCALAVKPTKKKQRACRQQALLIIMKLLLEAHLESNPKDNLANGCVHLLSAVRRNDLPDGDHTLLSN